MTVSENKVALASSLWILARKLLCRGSRRWPFFPITFMIWLLWVQFSKLFLCGWESEFHFHYPSWHKYYWVLGSDNFCLSHVWQIHRSEYKSCGLHMGLLINSEIGFITHLWCNNKLYHSLLYYKINKLFNIIIFNKYIS